MVVPGGIEPPTSGLWVPRSNLLSYGTTFFHYNTFSCYNKDMKTKKGFTVLEIIIVAIFASLLLILFFIQKSNLDAMKRDEDRKTAINAMYFALEEGYYAKHKYYPEEINEEVIPYIDPALWSDPNGIHISDGASSYSYTPANCEKGHCKEYVLKAELEKEDAYIKNSRNN